MAVFQAGSLNTTALIVPDILVQIQPLVGEPKATALDNFFGFSPGMAPLFPAYQAGDLLVAHATGSVDTTRSHFVAQRYMETGKPQDLSLHNSIFRCPMEFNAEHTEILFDPKFLSYKTTGGLTLLKSIVGYYIRHRMKSLPLYDQTMAATVSLAIPSVIGTGNCNIEFIANSIGLSSKKLRRLLAAEATTFSDILDGARSEMACRYLIESDAPVASIAGLLDYSAAPPFILAFRRWTGKSPLEFRKHARGGS